MPLKLSLVIVSDEAVLDAKGVKAPKVRGLSKHSVSVAKRDFVPNCVSINSPKVAKAFHWRIKY